VGIVFGLFPALHSTRPDLVSALRNNWASSPAAAQRDDFRTSARHGADRARYGTTDERRSLPQESVEGEPSGPRRSREKLVTFSVSPEESGYDSVRTKALFTRLEDELTGMPGATAVTSALVPLIAGNNWNSGVKVEGFKAMRIPA
jgi:hypothetical protein